MRARTFGRVGTALGRPRHLHDGLRRTAQARRRGTIVRSRATSTRPAPTPGATGHYAVQGTGLHIWTEGSTSTDKVAEYVTPPRRWPVVGEPVV